MKYEFEDLKEIAAFFRGRARVLAAVINDQQGRSKLPTLTLMLVREAATWEAAANILENSILVGPEA